MKGSFPSREIQKWKIRCAQLGVNILDARRVLASTIENLILRPGTYHSLIRNI